MIGTDLLRQGVHSHECDEVVSVGLADHGV